MEVPDDIIYNFLIELKKKDINPIDKANIIKKYCKENNMSIRGLAKELGVPHSTLQDWVDYSRITKEEYNIITKKGAGKKTIHKMLRETRGKEAEFNEIIEIELNIKLKDAIVKITPYIYNIENNNETIGLITKLRDILNRIELRIERK